MKRAAWSLALVVALGGCERSVGVVALPAIYGDDDRAEIVSHPDETVRRVGMASVFAMERSSWPVDWHLCDPEALTNTARTHGELNELCPEVRFAEQQATADCSATLVDDDLVLTASHCLTDEEDCAATRFVGGLYLEADGALRTIARDDVYHCQRIVAVPEGRDAVIVQLDRPAAAPYRPASIGVAPELGDPLTVIGFPAGVPMKVADHCEVLRFTASGATFRSNCDVFGGNSGSGVFDAEGAIVGVMTLGAGSYRPDLDRGGCRVLTLYDMEGHLLTAPMAAPQLSEAEMMPRIVDALCATDWPTPLCGREAACGDSFCSGRETHESCAVDCAEPSCGDGRCSPGEDYVCTEDCGARDASECAEPDAGVGGGVDAGVDAGEDGGVDAGVERFDGGPSDGGVVADAALERDAGPMVASAGCSCSAGGRSAGWPWVGLLMLIARRRSSRR